MPGQRALPVDWQTSSSVKGSCRRIISATGASLYSRRNGRQQLRPFFSSPEIGLLPDDLVLQAADRNGQNGVHFLQSRQSLIFYLAPNAALRNVVQPLGHDGREDSTAACHRSRHVLEVDSPLVIVLQNTAQRVVLVIYVLIVVRFIPY